MKKLLLTTLALGVMSMVGTAQATSITYQDSTIDFPGYTTGFGDTNGNPQVESMVITYNDDTNILESVVVNMANRLVFDTLFINNDSAGQGWDYLIRDYHSDNRWVSNNNNQGGIFEVAEDYDYTLVQAGLGGRTGHPNGIESEDLTLLSGCPSITWSGSSLTYNLSRYGIVLGEAFSFAYAPWCANDVMMTPEPASMLLFGAGLAGLVGIATRRKKNTGLMLS